MTPAAELHAVAKRLPRAAVLVSAALLAGVVLGCDDEPAARKDKPPNVDQQLLAAAYRNVAAAARRPIADGGDVNAKGTPSRAPI